MTLNKKKNEVKTNEHKQDDDKQEVFFHKLNFFS